MAHALLYWLYSLLYLLYLQAARPTELQQRAERACRGMAHALLYVLYSLLYLLLYLQVAPLYRDSASSSRENVSAWSSNPVALFHTYALLLG
jgi:hypothetical protein